MKKNISISSFLVILLMASQAFAQGEMGLFFSTRSIQQTFVQPAYYPEAKLHFALPQVALQLEHTGFKPFDMLSPIVGTDSFRVDPGKALEKMPENPFVNVRGAVEPFLLSFRAAKLQFTLSARARFQAHFSYPKDLVELAWEGNADKLGEELSLAPDFMARAYQDIGLGVAIPITPNLRVGIRAKYLGGFADVSVVEKQLNFTTREEYYQLNFLANYQIRTSQLAMTNLSTGAPEPEFVVQPYSSNWGLGLDLGLTYKTEKWMASASLLDYGYITWRANANQYGLSGELEFDGVDAFGVFVEDSMAIQEFADSLLDNFEITEKNLDSYTTFLPSRVYLGGTYFLPWKMRLGLVGQMEFLRGNTQHAFMLSVQQDVWKFLTLGLNASYRNGYFGQVGANALMKLGPVVLFLGSDNLLPFAMPKGARYTNFRGGMSLSFN